MPIADSRRRDPEALLALVQAEGEQEARTRGRLKVFFGATAGVGKTYAMLEAAQERRRAGTDVVIGIVETHGRRETAALLAGLELLPRLRIGHRGVVLEEFDLDRALARRPALLLVDELAHTNAPGCRHEKRWQDVEELLAAGIDVYTTLNVQHLESLNDVVARITGIAVRETVPDTVLERADEVEIVDLPPDELLERLREGKVYVPEQAERAMERFFRKGNLTALRQLALLRTADRVDRQMEVYRRASGTAEPWPVRERLLVGVGPAPSAERLVRATKRMADRLGAEWVAVFVEVPAAEHWPQPERDRVWETLRLAERLGARTATLTGADAPTAMLGYARSHNVTKIVVGKPTHATWRDVFGLSFHDRIVRGSGGIDVYVITGDDGEVPLKSWRHRASRSPSRLGAYVWTVGGVALVTAIAALLARSMERTNLAMLYLAVVVVTASRLGRGPAVTAAILSVATFDFFFVPPQLTFAVADTQYLVTFAVMLLVGLVIGTLTARLRGQGDAARRRETRTALLYDVTRDLASAEDERMMPRLVVPRIGAAVGATVDVLLPDAAGNFKALTDGGETRLDDPAERGIVAWVIANRKPGGAGTGTFAGRQELYLPIATASRSFGVLRVRSDEPDRIGAPEQVHLLETLAGQLAAAMERARLVGESRRARQVEELDRLKNEFVAVASRELQAPLAGIERQLAALAETAAAAPRREPMIEGAKADLARLRRLVTDLLDLSRLEAGRLELALRPHAPSALVAAALQVIRGAAADGTCLVTTDVATDLPSVEADERRITAVLVGLLDNAFRFAGPAGHIVVSADRVGPYVQFAVADDGPGIALEDQARIFDKFVRLGPSDQPPGLGLGLAVAREIVHRHRGAIWVDSGPGPGSVFSFTLPVATEGHTADGRP